MPILFGQGMDTPEGGMVMFVLLSAAMAAPLVGPLAIVATCLLFSVLRAVPPPYRKLEPRLVWPLLVPVLSPIWSFFVYSRVSRSYQAYFAARRRTGHGDCGEKFGLSFAICYALCWVCPGVLYLGSSNVLTACALSVPCLVVLGSPTVVLLIFYLVKVVGLTKYVTD
jgi:hypothetical protein